MLGSASYLCLSLVYTRGTPIADMLAHSPPLPLMVKYYFHGHYITEKDEEGMNLALGYHDRVRRISLLQMPAHYLQKLSMTIDNEFPILEDLMIVPPVNTNINLILPKTFQAPRLRRLILRGFSPIGSPLLATATGIVLLSLTKIHPSAYFTPNDLIQQFSRMPQLEALELDFLTPVPNHTVERQLLLTPITTRVTLPKLRSLMFKGVSAYLEALLPQMTTPVLEKFHIWFFNQLTFSVPCLLQFLSTTENFSCKGVVFGFFSDYVGVGLHPGGASIKPTFQVVVLSGHLDWQVSSITQIVNALGSVFSSVEHLTLPFWGRSQSPQVHNRVDRTQWRRRFGPFSNVKTLRVADSFDSELSCFPRLDDGESSMELFPELNELSIPASGNVGDAFTSFIDARRNTEHPVALVRRGTSFVR
jgi:hypothetical protein